MQNEASDPLKVAEAVPQIVKVISKLNKEDQSRALSAARAVLLDRNEDDTPRDGKKQSDRHRNVEGEETPDIHDLAEFFNRGDKKLSPSDNAFLCAAWHFKRYGAAPFSIDEIRTTASDTGVVLPDRVDKTFQNAGNRGKKLFASSGKRMFKPTASGGQFFHTEYAVRPGREKKEGKQE